jgi:hypothetical protein
MLAVVTAQEKERHEPARQATEEVATEQQQR